MHFAVKIKKRDMTMPALSELLLGIAHQHEILEW